MNQGSSNKKNSLFNSESQPDYSKRPKRGKSKRNELISAVEKRCGSVESYCDKIVELSLGNESCSKPNPQLMQYVLQRIIPTIKPVSRPVDIKFKSKTQDGKNKEILTKAENGEVSLEEANAYLQLVMNIESLGLIERLEAVENAVKQSKAT